MIFQRRFHSHTPTTIDSPPAPPPKDVASTPKTLEEILAIAVSPRAPKPPPHAVGTVASNPRIIKQTQFRSASSPLKSTVPRRAPSSRKTGHATIRTDAIDGHDAFESDAFAVHMPTTRIPIIDAPVSRSTPGSAAKARVEAVRTYKDKARQARERNNSIGVRVPPNIASYDYAYTRSPKGNVALPAVLKPSNSPPAPAGAFPVSPPIQQETWTQQRPKPEPGAKVTKIPSNTSVYRKPTVLGVTTSAAVIKESVQYVRADANGGASAPITPPRSTTVKISMKPKIPTVTTETFKQGSCQSGSCQVEHCRGIYYHPPRAATNAKSRSPSPTKTMPNFTRQYSVEGDSIFGYKVKDPLGTSAGAHNSHSNSSSSEDEKPKATTSKTQDTDCTPQKRTLTDRWPWIRKGGGSKIGKPPATPAPDPPVRSPTPRRPVSVYTSPFETIPHPPKTPPLRTPLPARSTPLRPAATAAAKATTTAKPATAQHTSPKKPILVPRTTSPTPSTTSRSSAHFDTGFAQIKSLFLLSIKLCFALYLVIAFWFVLDAVREALCALSVPFRLLGHAVGCVWAVVSFFGRGLGVVVGGLGGRVRVLGR